MQTAYSKEVYSSFADKWLSKESYSFIMTIKAAFKTFLRRHVHMHLYSKDLTRIQMGGCVPIFMDIMNVSFVALLLL